MKKIAIVANSTWNIYNFRRSLILYLISKNYQVVVISPVDKYLSKLKLIKVSQHIPIHKLSPQGKNPFQDISLLNELFQIYKKEKFDFIFHYTIKPNVYGSIAAKWLNIPCVSTVTGLGYTFIHQSLYTRLIKPLYRFAFKKNHKVIFHNPDDLNLLVKLQLVNPQLAQVIKGSGVDTTFFQPDIIATSKKEFIFLFIGRLLYDKGIVEFANAAQQVKQSNKNTECWILGELNTQNPSIVPKVKLEEWTKKGFVKYLGASDNVKNIIAKANVVVLPSYREGLPRSILEAMAMGKPIITTDVPGCRETVEDNINGYLVEPQSASSLAQAMKKISDLGIYDIEKMGKASRIKAINEFDNKIINQQYLNILEAILE